MQTHVISEAFEQLSKSEKLNESKDQVDVHEVSESKSTISRKDIELLAKKAINATTKSDLNKIISPLLSYNRDKWLHYSQMIQDNEYSIPAIGKMISDDLYWELQDSNNDLIVDESKLTERYSFPEVDDALNHFWNDLGKDPEVDDVIGFLEREYPDWVPIDPEDYGRWYHDVAGEISARLSESKLTEAPMSPKEYADMRRARKSQKPSNDVLTKINSQITSEMSTEDQLDVYFKELVPASGEAETVAGEIIRAMMRILYRDYNDGDLWYTGYGVETCGDSVIYLIQQVDDLQDDFQRMANAQLEETAYTDALNDIAAKVIVYLNENPELFTTPNTSSSRSGRGEDLESYFDLPTYEFDVDASYDEDEFDVDDDEIDDFINDIVDSDFSGAKVNRWAQDAWTIEDLDKDQLEYLEEIWEKWFSQFLEEHRREDDYEEDFEESLNESNKPLSKMDVNKLREIAVSLGADRKKLYGTSKQGLIVIIDKLRKHNQKRENDMNKVAEDFEFNNLEKIGTNEYEANKNRDKHIKMYRKFANISESEPITEETINEYALNKTATYCNREPSRIKAEILGQRYSEYEQE